MAETPQAQPNAIPQDAATPDAGAQESGIQMLGTEEQLSQLVEAKAAELEQLVTEQLSNANPETPITMTELLAGEGAFASKAKELGLTEEWQQFTAEQEEIGKMREELIAVEEQREAHASKVAGVTPSLEQAAGEARKSSMLSGVIGTLGGAAVAGVAVAKKTQSTPMRGLAVAAGGLLGGAVAAVFGARRGAKKAVSKIEQQVGDLGTLKPDAELEQKSAELQQQLGSAQQESISAIVNTMVERMVEQQVMAEQQAAAGQQAQDAQQDAAQQTGAQLEAAAQGQNAPAPKEKSQAEVEQQQSRPHANQQPHAPGPHAQKVGALAPMEQMLARRAVGDRGEPSSKAEAILQERQLAAGSERQI